MKYQDSLDSINTATKILKVNHAGEFGAINIYRAQILISKLFQRSDLALLQSFLEDESRHLKVFWSEIQRRGGIKCKSYWLCGLGGWVMGFVSALFGKAGVMACTLAVESVVANHLREQLVYLDQSGDIEASFAVKSIIEDEEKHRDLGLKSGGASRLYAPFRLAIRLFTEMVIRIGMR